MLLPSLMSAACCSLPHRLLPAPTAAPSAFRPRAAGFSKLLEETEVKVHLKWSWGPGEGLWMVVIDEGIDGQTLPF